jgi:hypothetical protein
VAAHEPIDPRIRLAFAQWPDDAPRGAVSTFCAEHGISRAHSFQQVLVIIDGDKIAVADLEGEILIQHTRPAPGVTYVGNGRPRGPHPNTAEASLKS